MGSSHTTMIAMNNIPNESWDVETWRDHPSASAGLGKHNVFQKSGGKKRHLKLKPLFWALLNSGLTVMVDKVGSPLETSTSAGSLWYLSCHRWWGRRRFFVFSTCEDVGSLSKSQLVNHNLTSGARARSWQCWETSAVFFWNTPCRTGSPRCRICLRPWSHNEFTEITEIYDDDDDMMEYV